MSLSFAINKNLNQITSGLNVGKVRSLSKNDLLNLIEKAEDKIQSNFYQKSILSVSLVLLLLVGLLPLSADYVYKIYKANNLSKHFQAEELIEESLQIDSFEEKHQKLLLAKEIDPYNQHLTLEFAILAVNKGDLKQVQKLSQKLQKHAIYSNALQGYILFKQGKYLYAETFLNKAYEDGFEETWLINSLGTILTKKANLLKSFQVAGWPSDCQANALAHSDCMRNVAGWHSKVSEIKDLDSKTKLFHQKRQIIFLGESLKSLLRAIEEVDGRFRLELINRYQKEKMNLLKAHALYSLSLHLKQVKITDSLTAGEKRFTPV